jgi:hypothetical protein
MDVSEAINKKTQVNALVVLGRELDSNSELTMSGIQRSEVAVYIADLMHPRIVVFSGGRSWRQVMAGVQPTISEGQAMLEHAVAYSLRKSIKPLSDKVEWVTEDESTSTVQNLIFSSPLLNLQPNENLAILSDELHYLYNRPTYLAHLVYPQHEILPLSFKTVMTQNDKDHERQIAIATKLFMFGVRSGNFSAILKRQRALEATNQRLRGLGSLLVRQPSKAEPA